MKKHLFTVSLNLLLLGCAAEKREEPAISGSSNRTVATSRANTSIIQPAANDSPMPVVGEMFERGFEVDFKDGLPADWEALDPERENPSVFEAKNGLLRLKIPPGRDLYGENMTAPRLWKTVSGDFEIETRVKFSPVESYQGAGLLIFRNDSNYLRLERAYGGTGGGESGIRFDVREDETYEPIAMQDKFPTAAREVDLRFRRAGKEFTAFWRESGKREWIEIGKVTNNYPGVLRVGLIGVSTADEITAEFAYLKLVPVK